MVQKISDILYFTIRKKEKKEMCALELPDIVKIQSRDYYTPSFDHQSVTDVQQYVNKTALSVSTTIIL